MKVIANLWRLIAIPLSVAVIVLGVLFFIDGKDIIDPATNFVNTELLIIYAAGFVLSLSTMLRPVFNPWKKRSAGLKAFLTVIMLILGAVLMPLFLLISIFGRLGRMFAHPVDPDERRPAKDEPAPKETVKGKKRDRSGPMGTAYINSMMWNLSAARAIAKLRDENYSGNIIVDDGDTAHTFSQVALIKLTGKEYALLCPIDRDGATEVYAIIRDPKLGTETLLLVENENLYRRVYSVYDALVAEKQIFG
ncbi:MAG: DUF1292 domain-containing protein [Clostridia bacterium]|nr:DUF1292 domain-containing protein [Clostridia bacterium]